MVFNIIQQGTRYCRVCGTSLWLAPLFDTICDNCRRKEEEKEKPENK